MSMAYPHIRPYRYWRGVVGSGDSRSPQPVSPIVSEAQRRLDENIISHGNFWCKVEEKNRRWKNLQLPTSPATLAAYARQANHMAWPWPWPWSTAACRRSNQRCNRENLRFNVSDPSRRLGVIIAGPRCPGSSLSCLTDPHST